MAKSSPKKDSEAIVSKEETKKVKRKAKLAKNAEVIAKPVNDKAEANAKPNAKIATKAKKDAQAKPKLHKRIHKTFKEMISELKKVTWPKWKTVVTSTTVVIVVVLFFLIVLTAMDFGLVRLLRLLTEKAVG